MNPVLLMVAAAAINGPIDPGTDVHTLDWPVSELRPFHLDSGLKANAGVNPLTAFAQVVTVPEARWLRLYFGDVVLQAGSSVRVTSLLDGMSRRIEADSLVLATTNVAETSLREGLAGSAQAVHIIGDCVAPRMAPYAFYEGRKLALSL